MELHNNLKYLAMTRVAITIWEREDIKEKMRHFYYFVDSSGELQNLMKELMIEVQQLMLPFAIQKHLMYVVNAIGVKRFNWIKFVLKCTDCLRVVKYPIFWTACGRINVSKIFKLVWLKDPNMEKLDIYKMACNYCYETDIYQTWLLLSNRTKHFFDYSFNEGIVDYNEHLYIYWHKFISGELHLAMDKFCMQDPLNIYDIDHSIDENMLNLCLRQGYEHAAIYFWNKLSDNERKQKLLHTFSFILPNKRNELYNRFTINESCGYVLSFMMKKLSDEERATIYLNYKRSLLVIFVNIWPWNENLIQLFEEVQVFFTADDYDWFLIEITYIMINNRIDGIEAEHSHFQKALWWIWKQIPSDVKRNIGENNWYICVRALLLAGDVTSIKLIMNDPALAWKREKIFESAAYAAAYHKKGSYELMQQVTNSEEESRRLDKIVKSREHLC